ncbi:MAG: hypothetical protein ACRDO4_04290 [Nocardioides sp.]
MPQRFVRMCMAVAMAFAGAVLVASPASANTHNYGTSTTDLGGGSSYQHHEWDFDLQRIRLVSKVDSTSSGDKCLDAAFDWRTSNGAHYDARVVRNCDPGSYLETDAAGDGFWDEPASWDNRPVNGVSRAFAVVVDDDNLHIDNKIRISPAQGSCCYGDGYSSDEAPPTNGQYNVAIITRYDSGTVVSRWADVKPMRCSQNVSSCP